MKEPSEWDEDYILNNLPKGENDQLEFKGRREIDLSVSGLTNVNEAGLAKALSALANSGGGFLILGIDDKTRSVDDGGINKMIKPNGTKAWLEDLLPQLVDPALVKLNVFEIDAKKEGSFVLPGRALYVAEVGDSPLAPHQSKSDHIYYGRVAGKSRPMGNRMVLDILNRRQFPNLDIKFYFASVDEADPNLFRREGRHKVLSVQIVNNGPVYAKYVNSILFVPEYLIEPNAIRIFLQGYPVVLEDGLRYIRIIRENVLTENFSYDGQIQGRSPGRYIPILPGRMASWEIPLVDDFLILRPYFKKQVPRLIWELYADNAPVQKGERAMRNIGFIDNVVERE